MGDKGARRGDRKVGAHRGHIRPLLDEGQPVGVFDIDMAVMRQTPRLAARPRAMLGAERDHALAILGGQDDVAGDEDHWFPSSVLRSDTMTLAYVTIRPASLAPLLLLH